MVQYPMADISCTSGWEWVTNQTDPALYYTDTLSQFSNDTGATAIR